ncbi:hypothetical protein [Streptomyces virginiae]|uniref:hypothetical protein n=1 Tax=Streptomyces virginiae TaxID=1961 RepID=UPI0036F81D3B
MRPLRWRRTVRVILPSRRATPRSVALDGTSMAARYVAGVAALCEQAHPSADPDLGDRPPARHAD